MHDFKSLNIWKRAIDLAEIVYKITEGFPDKEKYGLTNQIRRCCVSISSNIAEGCGRNSDKEFMYFLSIANGSTCELHSQVILSNRLNFLSAIDLRSILNLLNEIKNMNYKLQDSLNSKLHNT